MREDERSGRPPGGRAPVRGAALLVAMLTVCAAEPVICAPPEDVKGAAAGISVPDPAATRVLAALEKAGWAPSEPLRTFSPENLYEEIDGEAELFLPYDFRSMTVAILKSALSPGVDLRLESYRHGTWKDAFGIFSQYRYPEQETVRVGTAEAAVSDASLDFFRGDTFIRMRVAAGTLSRRAIVSAGRAAIEAIGGPTAVPTGAVVVAIQSAVSGTIIYQKKAMLGYEPLAPGYEARFASGALSGKVVFMDGSKSGAGHLERLAKGLPGFREAGKGEWVAALPQGALYLAEAGTGTVGVLGKLSREQAAPFLAELLRNAASAGVLPAFR